MIIQEKTNRKMMILSCIGIIFVVLGHTGDQLNLASNIFPYYSFHMPLFMFISGYFYKAKNEDNLWGKSGYIYKKIRRLVIPYFIWNLIYGIIVNIFRNTGVVAYGGNINFETLFIEPWITGHQYTFNIASWFMLALFLVNITYVLIRKFFKYIKFWNDNFMMIIFLIISCFSIYIAGNDISQNFIPFIRTGFFIFFYQFGYVYKTKIEGKIKMNTILYFFILIFIQLIFLKLEYRITYEAVFMKFYSKIIITPIIVSITGILFWTKISEILVPSLGNSKIIIYISNNTYDIMLHHLFWIFALNVFIYKIANVLGLDGFNVEIFKNTIYYMYTPGTFQFQIIYSIIALFMPLVVSYLYEKIKCTAITRLKGERL